MASLSEEAVANPRLWDVHQVHAWAMRKLRAPALAHKLRRAGIAGTELLSLQSPEALQHHNISTCRQEQELFLRGLQQLLTQDSGAADDRGPAQLLGRTNTAATSSGQTSTATTTTGTTTASSTNTTTSTTCSSGSPSSVTDASQQRSSGSSGSSGSWTTSTTSSSSTSEERVRAQHHGTQQTTPANSTYASTSSPAAARATASAAITTPAAATTEDATAESDSTVVPLPDSVDAATRACSFFRPHLSHAYARTELIAAHMQAAARAAGDSDSDSDSDDGERNDTVSPYPSTNFVLHTLQRAPAESNTAWLLHMTMLPPEHTRTPSSSSSSSSSLPANEQPQHKHHHQRRSSRQHSPGSGGRGSAEPRAAETEEDLELVHKTILLTDDSAFIDEKRFPCVGHLISYYCLNNPEAPFALTIAEDADLNHLPHLTKPWFLAHPSETEMRRVLAAPSVPLGTFFVCLFPNARPLRLVYKAAHAHVRECLIDVTPALRYRLGRSLAAPAPTFYTITGLIEHYHDPEAVDQPECPLSTPLDEKPVLKSVESQPDSPPTKQQQQQQQQQEEEGKLAKQEQQQQQHNVGGSDDDDGEGEDEEEGEEVVERKQEKRRHRYRWQQRQYGMADGVVTPIRSGSVSSVSSSRRSSEPNIHQKVESLVDTHDRQRRTTVGASTQNLAAFPINESVRSRDRISPPGLWFKISCAAGACSRYLRARKADGAFVVGGKATSYESTRGNTVELNLYFSHGREIKQETIICSSFQGRLGPSESVRLVGHKRAHHFSSLHHLLTHLADQEETPLDIPINYRERYDWEWLKLSFSRQQAAEYLLQHPQQLCVVRTSTSLPDRLVLTYRTSSSQIRHRLIQVIQFSQWRSSFKSTAPLFHIGSEVPANPSLLLTVQHFISLLDRQHLRTGPPIPETRIQRERERDHQQQRQHVQRPSQEPAHRHPQSWQQQHAKAQSRPSSQGRTRQQQQQQQHQQQRGDARLSVPHRASRDVPLLPQQSVTVAPQTAAAAAAAAGTATAGSRALHHYPSPHHMRRPRSAGGTRPRPRFVRAQSAFDRPAASRLPSRDGPFMVSAQSQPHFTVHPPPQPAAAADGGDAAVPHAPRSAISTQAPTPHGSFKRRMPPRPHTASTVMHAQQRRQHLLQQLQREHQHRHWLRPTGRISEGGASDHGGSVVGNGGFPRGRGTPYAHPLPASQRSLHRVRFRTHPSTDGLNSPQRGAHEHQQQHHHHHRRRWPRQVGTHVKERGPSTQEDGTFILRAQPEKRQLLLNVCYRGRWNTRVIAELDDGFVLQGASPYRCFPTISALVEHYMRPSPDLPCPLRPTTANAKAAGDDKRKVARTGAGAPQGVLKKERAGVKHTVGGPSISKTTWRQHRDEHHYHHLHDPLRPSNTTLQE